MSVKTMSGMYEGGVISTVMVRSETLALRVCEKGETSKDLK